ncbi:superoxide dismutase [Planoprotostelium fungivorum]|uniref:Superoxide dismutase n=1 Tax=Planoprotostelium fungivorum TaxID=1890364 RepID=A0A2P6MR15_9EUKA|nr:superoxide dismutase [Planoprotostelium fungivorum]
MASHVTPLLNNLRKGTVPLRHFTGGAAPSAGFKLPDLPYDHGALAPVISGQIMELHHKKHHQAYVTNLNAALDKFSSAQSRGDTAELSALTNAIKFNGGGHVNHSIFWTNLAPKSQGGGEAPKGELAERINKHYGSLDNFITKFNAQAAGVQGSGWGWLAYEPSTDALSIVTLPNQDPLSTLGLVPLLGIDVWEHAYYLDYKNARPDYLKAIWQVVNWKNVTERFDAAKKK